MRLLALLIVAMLSGCLLPPGLEDDKPAPAPTTSDPPEPDPGVIPPVTNDTVESGTAPLLTNFTFSGCSGFAIRGTIAAIVPENYTASSDQATWRILHCEQFTVANVVVNDTVIGVLDIPVLDPGYGDPGPFTYRPLMMAQPDIMAQLWPAGGLPTYIGEWSASSTIGLLEVDNHAFSLGDYTADGVSLTSEAGVNRPGTAYTQTDQGRVSWTGQLVAGTELELVGNVGMPGTDPYGVPDDAVAVAITEAGWSRIDLVLTV